MYLYVCPACGRRIGSVIPYAVANDEAWHDKGYDDIRQRHLIPGTFAAGLTACGPLRLMGKQ